MPQLGQRTVWTALSDLWARPIRLWERDLRWHGSMTWTFCDLPGPTRWSDRRSVTAETTVAPRIRPEANPRRYPRRLAQSSPPGAVAHRASRCDRISGRNRRRSDGVLTLRVMKADLAERNHRTAEPEPPATVFGAIPRHERVGHDRENHHTLTGRRADPAHQNARPASDQLPTRRPLAGNSERRGRRLRPAHVVKQRDNNVPSPRSPQSATARNDVTCCRAHT